MLDSDFEGEKIVVECCGSILEVTRAKKGFYVCPVCGESIFFSEKDLFHHIVSHALDTIRYRHRIPKFRK